MKTVCLTGVAGFIGFHLAKKLDLEGYRVVGIDNLNSYYDKQLKLDRLSELQKLNKFEFIELDISDNSKMTSLDDDFSFDIVINLAAQAGVQYSLVNPHEYISSNVNGAACTLQNEKGSWSLSTPGSAVVTNSRENLSVKCQKAGYQTAIVSVPSKHKDSATWGNVILGGGIGYIWDRKSGAAFIYPSTINLTLIKDESSTSTSQKSDIKLTGSTTTEQLTQLNDLYKAGVLTEEEFTKAKKKILD